MVVLVLMESLSGVILRMWLLIPVPDPGDRPIPDDKELPVRYWSGSDPGDVVEVILFELLGTEGRAGGAAAVGAI